MLDENREIWVQVYGPDQSMTHVDVQVVDDRAATLLAALEPVRDELTTLRTRIADETVAALAGKVAADAAREQALVQADQATAKRDKALAQAEQARRQAEDDHAGLVAAEQAARAAGEERDQAVADRRAAQRAKDSAEADRQRALEQVAAAQDRVTELQNTLAGERAGTVERLDRLRQEADREHQKLRASLTEDRERRLQARTDEFTDQLHRVQATADQRIADLTGQLTAATRQYADALGPLHEQLAGLRTELAERAAAAAELRQHRDTLRLTARRLLEHVGDETLRRRFAATLHDPAETHEHPVAESDTAG
jgi:chromosome segregation ATPase